MIKIKVILVEEQCLDKSMYLMPNARPNLISRNNEKMDGTNENKKRRHFGHFFPSIMLNTFSDNDSVTLANKLNYFGTVLSPLADFHCQLLNIPFGHTDSVENKRYLTLRQESYREILYYPVFKHTTRLKNRLKQM